MIKVLESGKKTYRVECQNCGCLFAYETVDITPQGFVHCPECRSSCGHNRVLNAYSVSEKAEEVARSKITLEHFKEQVKDCLEDKWFKDLDSKFLCCVAIDELFEEFGKCTQKKG